MIHKDKGILKFKRKEYKAMGNKIVDIYTDEQGNETELDGTEIPLEQHLKMLDGFSMEENSKKLREKIDKDISEIEYKAEEKEMEEKEAHREEKAQRHTEVVQEVKNASEAIVGAVKDIPKTVIPEFPDHYKEEKIWQEKVLEVLRKEINLPEANFEPVVKAVQALKFPEVKIPEPLNYTALLKEIKNALPENTDMSGVIEAIKEIPQPKEIPFEFKNGRLKVEVDRISLNSGGGGTANGATEAKQDDIISAINGNYDTVDVDKSAYPTITVVKKLSGDTVSTKTVQIIG